MAQAGEESALVGHLFAVAHISIKCSTQSLSRLVFCEVDYCLLKVLGFPLAFIGFDDFLILLV